MVKVDKLFHIWKDRENRIMPLLPAFDDAGKFLRNTNGYEK